MAALRGTNVSSTHPDRVDVDGVGEIKLVKVGGDARQRAYKSGLEYGDIVAIYVHLAHHVLVESLHALLVEKLVHAGGAQTSDIFTLTLGRVAVMHFRGFFTQSHVEDGHSRKGRCVDILLDERKFLSNPLLAESLN